MIQALVTFTGRGLLQLNCNTVSMLFLLSCPMPHADVCVMGVSFADASSRFLFFKDSIETAKNNLCMRSFPVLEVKTQLYMYFAFSL